MKRNKGCINCKNSYGLLPSDSSANYYNCRIFQREIYNALTGETKTMGGRCEELNKDGDCPGFDEHVNRPTINPPQMPDGRSISETPGLLELIKKFLYRK